MTKPDFYFEPALKIVGNLIEAGALDPLATGKTRRELNQLMARELEAYVGNLVVTDLRSRVFADMGAAAVFEAWLVIKQLADPSINTVDLRERLAIGGTILPGERKFILAALAHARDLVFEARS